MSLETEIVLRVDPEALLSAIWYSDGSGASGRVGVSMTTLPEDWRLVRIWFNKEEGWVELTLRRRETEELPSCLPAPPPSVSAAEETSSGEERCTRTAEGVKLCCKRMTDYAFSTHSEILIDVRTNRQVVAAPGDSDPFIFCPWCRESLMDETSPDKEPTADGAGSCCEDLRRFLDHPAVDDEGSSFDLYIHRDDSWETFPRFLACPWCGTKLDDSGPVAQPEESLPCKQWDEGSNPSGSTKLDKET